MSKATIKIEDFLPYLKFIRNKKQEYFVCLSLDSAMRVIARRTVTIGLVDQSLAHPREVFARPITDRASYVIIVHNHPSGIAEPSEADIRLTQQLAAAGQLLGIGLADHIIVTRSSYYSFKKEGHLIDWPRIGGISSSKLHE